MTSTELAWLAGLLEGEGSFLGGPPCEPRQPRVRLQMTDKDVVEKVAALLKRKIIKSNDSRNAAWKPWYAVTVKGAPAVELMKKLYPLMGKRRQGQIDRAMATHLALKPFLKPFEVPEIRKLITIWETAL